MWVAVPLVMDGKVNNHAVGNKKLLAIVSDQVGVLRRRMGREHDFRVDDFALVGIVFLLRVVFRK